MALSFVRKELARTKQSSGSARGPLGVLPFEKLRCQSQRQATPILLEGEYSVGEEPVALEAIRLVFYKWGRGFKNTNGSRGTSPHVSQDISR